MQKDLGVLEEYKIIEIYGEEFVKSLFGDFNREILQIFNEKQNLFLWKDIFFNCVQSVCRFAYEDFFS